MAEVYAPEVAEQKHRTCAGLAQQAKALSDRATQLTTLTST